MEFPEGKRFAFSILDDTDDSTVSNVEPVYAFLREIGMRTTKTVWPVGCPEGSRLFFAGETLENRGHLRMAHDLAEAGFEIASHGATMESSLRARTLEALEVFKKEFGAYPRLFANHGYNRDNLYWGLKRFQSLPCRLLAKTVRFSSSGFDGEEENSPYFWGDVCLKHVKYVRNFTFSHLNMLRTNPDMPYRICTTPYVNLWFSTSDAPNVSAFNRLLTRDRIDELERQGGVCIVSTHLGKGFVRDGRVNREVESILRYIAGKAGWFVPVSDVLDHMGSMQGRENVLSEAACLKLELRYLADRLLSKR